MSRLARLLMALSLMAVASPGEAAKFYALDHAGRNDPSRFFFEPVCNAQLHDVIRTGDYERIKPKLEAFAADSRTGAVQRDDGTIDFNPVSGPKGFLALCLSSRGGNINEAIRISALFEGWTMVVPAGAECSSACAILFMTGGRRDEVFWYSGSNAGRFLHWSAKLGFHAPRLEFPPGSPPAVSVGEAAQAYARALETVRSVAYYNWGGGDGSAEETSFVGAGTTRAKIPADLLLAFLTISPDRMFTVSTLEEAHRWGIEIFGVAPPAALTEAMLVSGCRNAGLVRCESASPPTHEGDCHHWGESWTPAAIEPDATTAWHADQGRRARYEESFANKLQTSKRKLWPKAGGAKSAVTMQRLELKAAPETEFPDRACLVTGAWHRNRLTDLDLWTFNGLTGTTAWSAALDEEEIAYKLKFYERGESVEGEYRLHPWKMIPIETKLSDLGTDPWGWLDDGADFFDKPPNFEQK